MENNGTMHADPELMKVYEIGYLLLPSVPEEKLLEEVTAIKGNIEKSGGVFLSEGFPQYRQLAYTMRKLIGGGYENFDSAYFGWIKFEAKPESVSEVKTALESSANILRHILIASEKDSGGPVKVSSLRKEEEEIATKKDEGTPEEKKEEAIDKSIDELVTSIE